jgi:bacterioferritin
MGGKISVMQHRAIDVYYPLGFFQLLSVPIQRSASMDVRSSSPFQATQQEIDMAKQDSDTGNALVVTREDLVALLNDDLAREYQAIISYVVYSQSLKGAKYMNIAAELQTHAAEELAHALIIAGQVDYLGGMALAVPKPVKTSAKAEDMLRFDLENENETIHHYRQRVRQCEALGEYAVAEHIRDILVQEQDHQVALANALGVEIPNVT